MGEVLTIDTTNPLEAFPTIIKLAGKGQPLLDRARYLGRALSAGPGAKDELSRIQCEVAGNLADRLGFDQAMLQALGQMFERWDGQGQPLNLKGEEIARPVRVVHLAHDAATIKSQADAETAINLVQKRIDRMYDPVIAEAFLQNATALFAKLEVDSTWEALLGAEPESHSWLKEEQFDGALPALADFTDLKSPYLTGHSRGVSALAEKAAQRCNLPEADAVNLRRAGLVRSLFQPLPSVYFGKNHPIGSNGRCSV